MKHLTQLFQQLSTLQTMVSLTAHHVDWSLSSWKYTRWEQK